jgi:hypothetical protein
MHIPMSVTSIGDWAFTDCTGLKSITIPKSVTYIGKAAFFNCHNLYSIHCKISDPHKITTGDYAFDKVKTKKCTLYVPGGSKKCYATAQQWKNFKKLVEK